MALNLSIIQGNLTKDPEMKQTKTGKRVCTFTVANNKRGKDAGCNFIDCAAWEATAELISKYLKKGSPVLVEGRLDQQTWEQDGMRRSKLIVIADSINFLGERKQEDNLPTEAEVAKDIDPSSIPF